MVHRPTPSLKRQTETAWTGTLQPVGCPAVLPIEVATMMSIVRSTCAEVFLTRCVLASGTPRLRAVQQPAQPPAPLHRSLVRRPDSCIVSLGADACAVQGLAQLLYLRLGCVPQSTTGGGGGGGEESGDVAGDMWMREERRAQQRALAP